VPLFCFTPYRKSQKEQATGNLFGFLLPCDRKEEVVVDNCTPFTPAMECLIAQGDGELPKDKAQQTGSHNGPQKGG
jgi:hypothetical protein